MRIKKIHVVNYGPILDATLECDKLAALVGANGTGKSTFLHAVSLFYAITPKMTVEDFHDRVVTVPIEITLTYTDLDADEKERFKSYTENDNLTVVRVLTLTENTYHGSALQNPEFRAFRDAKSGANIRTAYNALRNGAYAALPAYTNMEDAKAAIKNWELENPLLCVRERDDGQFFGFKQVGQGYLGKDTRVVFIPAVRDATDDSEEGRGSAITALMDMLVRNTLFEKEEIKEFRTAVQLQCDNLLDPTKIPELTKLGTDLSGTLKTYVSDASVEVSWIVPAEVEIPIPKANVRVIEDGFSTQVGKSGHGLQRAFILTILQHLSAHQDETAGRREQGATQDEAAAGHKLPDLILAIEEPELYQHPTRQRHFADVLMKLAGNPIPGVARKLQVIYATHSPLLVGLDRFDQVRTISKVPGAEGKPKVTHVVHRTLQQVAEKIKAAVADGKEFTGETLKARLVSVMSPSMNEGFFADVVVLVEGDNDRAVLEAAAISMGLDLNALGIALIPCGGKSGVLTVGAIFMSFDIPTYLVWDGDSHLGQTEGICEKCGHDLDSKAEPNENQRLLRLLGLEIADWPDHIQEHSACFKTKLEKVMKEEVGADLFNQLLNESKTKYAISKTKDAIKRSSVLAEVLTKAREQGHKCKSLEAIIAAIVELKGPAVYAELVVG